MLRRSSAFFVLVPKSGTLYETLVQVIARRTLKTFWDANPQAEAPLRAWYALVSRSNWKTPAEIRAMFNSADFVADNRVIFDIGGNKFRLVVRVSYQYGRVLVKFIGTHADYERIDPGSV